MASGSTLSHDVPRRASPLKITLQCNTASDSNPSDSLTAASAASAWPILSIGKTATPEATISSVMLSSAYAKNLSSALVGPSLSMQNHSLESRTFSAGGAERDPGGAEDSDSWGHGAPCPYKIHSETTSPPHPHP